MCEHHASLCIVIWETCTCPSSIAFNGPASAPFGCPAAAACAACGAMIARPVSSHWLWGQAWTRLKHAEAACP